MRENQKRQFYSQQGIEEIKRQERRRVWAYVVVFSIPLIIESISNLFGI